MSRMIVTLADGLSRHYALIMAENDKKSENDARDFPIEVQVGRIKVTVTLQLSPRVDVTVKETNVEIAAEADRHD